MPREKAPPLPQREKESVQVAKHRFLKSGNIQVSRRLKTTKLIKCEITLDLFGYVKITPDKVRGQTWTL